MESVDREKINTHFKKKEIIFHENEKIRGFYCIKSGLARIYKTTNTGKEQTFQIASRGKWLGFRDVISGLEYNHTAVCLEDSELCYISEETTKRLIKSDGMFQIEVLKYLAEEWKGIENHVHSMGTKQVHSRLAELLILFHNAIYEKSTPLSQFFSDFMVFQRLDIRTIRSVVYPESRW